MPQHLPSPATDHDHDTHAAHEPGPSRSAHRQAYLLCLLAGAPAALGSALTAYGAYVTPIDPDTHTLITHHLRTTLFALPTVWLLLSIPGMRQWAINSRAKIACQGVAGAVAALALLAIGFASPNSVWWAGRNMVMALLWTALALTVAYHHQITPARLGVWPRGKRTVAGRAEAAGVGAGMMLAGMVTSILFTQLPTLLPHNAAPFTGTQANFLGWASFTDQAANVLYSAAIEDVVMVGALVTLLTAARRPVWEMYTLSISFDVAMHGYLGFPAVGVVVASAAAVALYQRTGRLVAIAAGHVVYDVTTGLHLSTMLLGFVLVLVIAAAMLARDIHTPTPKPNQGQAQGHQETAP